MRGDPTHEQTHFECRVNSSGKKTVARFRTSESPTVHAGAGRAGSDADRAENDLPHASSIAPPEVIRRGRAPQERTT